MFSCAQYKGKLIINPYGYLRPRDSLSMDALRRAVRAVCQALHHAGAGLGKSQRPEKKLNDASSHHAASCWDMNLLRVQKTVATYASLMMLSC